MERRSAWIGMGANLGDAPRTLALAVERLGQCRGVAVRGVSSLYSTAPVDAPGPDYVNAVVRVETELGAEDLLAELQRIEKELGRIRPPGVRNAPRSIDLDLELYGDERIDNPPKLVVPHPRMHLRAFVLVPLLELDPSAVIPGLGEAKSFLEEVRDQPIRKIGPLQPCAGLR